MGRPSSPITYSDRRNGYQNRHHINESPIPHRRYRSRSPSYARYSPEHHRRKSPVSRRSRSRSPDHRKPIPRRDNYNPRRGRGNYGGNIVPEEESDEELRGLTFEEYRRLKRQKLRRSLKFSIWNVTPSPPPRSRNGVSDGDLDSEEAESDSESKKKSSKSRVTDDRVEKLGKDIDSGSGSGSGSDSEGKVKKSSRVRVKKSRKNTESGPGSDSGSGSVSDSDSRSRRRSRNKSSRRRKSKSKRKSRKSYDSDEDSEEEKESSEEDSKRRKSKSRRGSSNRKKKSSKSSSRRKSKRRISRDSETEDESGSEGKETRSKNKTKKRKTSSESSEEDAVRGKSVSDIEETGLKNVEESNLDEFGISPTKEVLDVQKMAVVLENEPLVGPQPLPKAEGHISYGGALRPGEGDAIAQYVQQGKRIPRRGEVGLSADEISKYEDLGYVMSGSRHQRMNAIRIRKENQVYSAEDKRALAMYNFEEKAKREGKVMADLTRLVSRTIGETVVSNHDPFGAGKDEGEE